MSCINIGNPKALEILHCLYFFNIYRAWKKNLPWITKFYEVKITIERDIPITKEFISVNYYINAEIQKLKWEFKKKNISRKCVDKLHF